jgi:hypothetical protein
MLPQSPRARPGGLPTTPRSRSTGPRPQNASRYAEEPALPPPSRHVRQQQSIAAFPRESPRSRQPPRSSSPTSESGWQRKHTHQSRLSYESAPELPRSRASQDSTSTTSSVSSLFDRVRNGATSYASSFTSVEDNDLDADQTRGRSLRKQRALSPEAMTIEQTDTGTGDGFTVWNRVATAASTLTISVSKAWAANISGDEPVTPLGEDSRLTKAMKAYHIEKAEDPSDLPEWLFSPSERKSRQVPRSSRTRTINEEPPAAVSRRAPPFPEPSLRGKQSVIQESQASTVSTPKGTDRLKALRDARRTPQVATSAHTYYKEQPRIAPAPPPAQRVGLPSRPQRRQGL